MATEVTMPKFGLSMEEGTIIKWVCSEGESVQKGQTLAEIESEKLTNTAEAPAEGVVRKILVAEGETSQCGQVICIIAGADEPIEGLIEEIKSTAPENTCEEVLAAYSMEEDSKGQQQSPITPRARKYADEKGIDYRAIEGTGIGGAITLKDLAAYRYKDNNLRTSGRGSVQPMTATQNTIAKAMIRSRETTAQSTLATEAKVKKLVEAYRELKPKYASEGIRLGYTAMLIMVVARVLEVHEEMRLQIVDEKYVRICSDIDIGVAVDVPNGLLVPVIREANKKNLPTICRELEDLVARARVGTLVESDIGNAVITITNLGMFDVTYFTPILNLPESVILGIGSIVEKPVREGVGVRFEDHVYLSLTHDHRILNGASCARFLQDVVKNLETISWR